MADFDVGSPMLGKHFPNRIIGRGSKISGLKLRDTRDPEEIFDPAEFLQFALMEHGDAVADILDVSQQV